MNESLQPPASSPPALRVAAGEDRFGERRGLGISFIDFKVSTQDSSGLFILENMPNSRRREAHTLHVARLLTQEISMMKDPRSPRQAFERQSKLLRDAFVDDDTSSNGGLPAL